MFKINNTAANESEKGNSSLPDDSQREHRECQRRKSLSTGELGTDPSREYRESGQNLSHPRLQTHTLPWTETRKALHISQGYERTKPFPTAVLSSLFLHMWRVVPRHQHVQGRRRVTHAGALPERKSTLARSYETDDDFLWKQMREKCVECELANYTQKNA